MKSYSGNSKSEGGKSSDIPNFRKSMLSFINIPRRRRIRRSEDSDLQRKKPIIILSGNKSDQKAEKNEYINNVSKIRNNDYPIVTEYQKLKQLIENSLRPKDPISSNEFTVTNEPDNYIYTLNSQPMSLHRSPTSKPDIGREIPAMTARPFNGSQFKVMQPSDTANYILQTLKLVYDRTQDPEEISYKDFLTQSGLPYGSQMKPLPEFLNSISSDKRFSMLQDISYRFISGYYSDDLARREVRLEEKSFPSSTERTKLSLSMPSLTTLDLIRIPCYILIFLTSIVGNSLVIVTMLHNTRMRTITNVFLLNLVSRK